MLPTCSLCLIGSTLLQMPLFELPEISTEHGTSLPTFYSADPLTKFLSGDESESRTRRRIDGADRSSAAEETWRGGCDASAPGGATFDRSLGRTPRTPDRRQLAA